jgi:hypothetical protein
MRSAAARAAALQLCSSTIKRPDTITDTILILYQFKSSHSSLLTYFVFDNAKAAFLGFTDKRNVSTGGACIVIGRIRVSARALPTQTNPTNAQPA